MTHEEYLKILSDNITRYLELYDMSRLELSKRIGSSPQSVTNWLSGASEPRMDKIDKMCEVFHCKRSDLLEPPVNDRMEELKELIKDEHIANLIFAAKNVRPEVIDGIIATLDAMKNS